MIAPPPDLSSIGIACQLPRNVAMRSTSMLFCQPSSSSVRPNPEGLRTLGEFPNLTATMEKRGWPETRIRKVMGGNWLRFLKDVWGA